MKEQILKKILNDDGTLRWAYSKSAYAQKYFTDEELKYIRNLTGRTLSEKYWCLINDIHQIPKCPKCGKTLKFNSFKEGGYQKYCSNSCTVTSREHKVLPLDQRKKRYEPKGVWKNRHDVPLPRPDRSKETWDEMIERGRQEKQNRIDHMKNGKAKEMLQRSIENNGCHPWNSEKAIASRFSRYTYKGIKFDSSWELAFWIWCIDHNINIERNTEKMFTYTNEEGKERWIIPDFKIGNQIIEVKGDQFVNGTGYLKEFDFKKPVLEENGVKILYGNDIMPHIDYIKKTYGAGYLKQFKNKSRDDFKRTIVEIEKVEDVFAFRNSTVKISYKCKNCNSEVITSATNVVHHPDMLCKKCRMIQ
jgi:predicted Zn-ribbon and HTH transcriptional regulator